VAALATFVTMMAQVVVFLVVLGIMGHWLVTRQQGPRLEVGYLMGKVEKIRETSQEIIKLLKQIPDRVAIEFGGEFELIPKPVLKVFFKIYVLNKLITKEQEKRNANRKEGNKRLHCDDEGVSQRDST